MSAQVYSFRLSHKGKPVGTHVLKAQSQGRINLLEGRTSYQGTLGTSTVVQRSRSHATRYLSLRYQEDTNERAGNRSFDVRFDAEKGIVTATRGPRDRATVPYLLPYRDPLSLLWEIRGLDDATEHLRVPMLGKEVRVQRVGLAELDTPLGNRSARAYLLHPGQVIVYLEVGGPRTLLKFSQRLQDGVLEGQLVKVGEEANMRDWPEPEGGGKTGGSKRRRRSRRRRSRHGNRKD